MDKKSIGSEKTIVKPAHILVVDDEPFILELIKNALDECGYTVSLAANGKTALAMFSENKPDLILLDILLPDITGYEILKRIRATSNIPVIMITGISDVDSLCQSLAAGANDHIRKPFQIAELAARVRAKLRRVSM